MQRVLKVVCTVAATLIVAGCTDYTSATNLNPEGPPEIRQVRMTENFFAAGATSGIERRVFAFGTHPMGLDADQHPVTSALAKRNQLRVVMDELLVGNNLEEIACRGPVDTDAYQRVPLGTTPDDIAKCSVAKDVLPKTCHGPHAVCLCDLDGGCGTGTDLIAKGAPVGVLDINQDGSSDDTRFIQGSVAIKCGTIDVPLDLDMTYWNPSGNQQPPAMGGFEALGPAIVLTPQRGLPTNIECGLVFSPDVIDKQGNQACTPVNGDETGACTPGDLSQFKFKVEPMTVDPLTFDNNMTGVSRTDPAILAPNVPVDPTAINTITITQDGAPYTTFTIALAMMGKQIVITPTGGFAANAVYKITIPTTFKDAFGQPLPQPIVITFTTGA